MPSACVQRSSRASTSALLNMRAVSSAEGCPAEGSAPLLRTVNPQIPAELEAICDRCLQPDPRLRSKRIVLEGEVANPAAPPSGCYFHPRCPYAVAMCRTETPAWQEISRGHFVSCHRAEELKLAGVE